MNDLEQRARWRIRWLGSIREIADISQQRRTWLNLQSVNPHYSFVEHICCYFDDLSLEGDLCSSWAVADGLISPGEAAVVASFHADLAGYSPPDHDDYDHEAILDDPAWRAIVAKAKAAVDSLRLLVVDPDELTALTEPSIEGLRASQSAGTA